jgi:hypothetical protein
MSGIYQVYTIIIYFLGFPDELPLAAFLKLAAGRKRRGDSEMRASLPRVQVVDALLRLGRQPSSGILYTWAGTGSGKIVRTGMYLYVPVP